MNMKAEETKKDNRKFILVEEQDEFLAGMSGYISRILNLIWENPEISFSIIKNSEIKELKEYLSPFFGDNLYENILSYNSIENNLIYLLTLLLEDEINELNNLNEYDNFLVNSPCGYLLEELRIKKDIQIYSKTILLDVIEKLENNYSSLNITFEIDNLNNSKINILDNKYDFNIFNDKYFMSLNKKNLEIILDGKKDNSKIYDFLNNKLNNSSENLYSNELLIEKFNRDLSYIYQENFLIAINFINEIIDNILNNIHLIPYSIRSICKIISLLIKKKFVSISEVEKNAYIAKFFFGKLLIPILKNPKIELFINNFIISPNTINNLNILNYIIYKFTSGNFYISTKQEENNYTPFNIYFIEKMEKLFDIFENLTKADLPSFIKKKINDELSPDYEYDYFIENSNELICHRSILLNLEQIKSILSIINRNKEIFMKKNYRNLVKIVEKLNNNIIFDEWQIINKKISQTQKSKKNNISKDKPNLYYFLFTSIIYNEKYQKIFNLKLKEKNFPKVELIKQLNRKLSFEEHNIIKAKKYFCNLLLNYHKLSKIDFDIDTMENTEKILSEINNKSSYLIIDDYFPSNWYTSFLLESLNKIPENLIKNDYEKLYEEIINEVNESIEELNLEKLFIFKQRSRLSKKIINFYEENKKNLIDIKLNKKIRFISENKLIPIDIIYSFDIEKSKEIFEIKKSNFKLKEKEKDKIKIEKIKEYENKKKLKLCLTIKDFIQKFPNLKTLNELKGIDIFEIQKNLCFSNKINNYIELIKENIKELGKEELDLIIEKIYDYIMENIYDKIFPIHKYNEDNIIFQKSLKLSWIEPKHLDIDKNVLISGNLLNDVLKYFKLIDKEKSPNKKFKNLKEINKLINILFEFNYKDKNYIGIDDIFPVFDYVLIKSKPLRIYSNAKFMELYLRGNNNTLEELYISILLSACELTTRMTYSYLRITQEEYLKKCSGVEDISN